MHHLLATTDLSPVVTIWIYLVAGIAIFFSTIAFICMIINGRHDEHLEDLHEEANK